MVFKSAEVTAAKENVLQKFWKLLFFGHEKYFSVLLA